MALPCVQQEIREQRVPCTNSLTAQARQVCCVHAGGHRPLTVGTVQRGLVH